MNIIKPVTEIKVGIRFFQDIIPVGRLALNRGKIYFEYESDFIKSGLEISPLQLKLKLGLFSFDYNLFAGLAGVFNDSLPDGWGKLLFDRFARSQGVLLSDLTALDRLAYVGQNAMGALVYQPDYSVNESNNIINLDQLASESEQILANSAMAGSATDLLEELMILNGSSAGARPKALINVNKTYDYIIHSNKSLSPKYTSWIVKFPNSQDGADAGAIEYVYSLMAVAAGIIMPDTYLFPAQKGAGYFAVKRFDLDGNKRYHMHTACGLLHSDFRLPALDYEDLIALTGMLTGDVREVKKMYQLAVFNVLAHNRDDHAKNFSFLMDDKGKWKLAPAYDLTFSSGPSGEQSTTILGEGKKPTIEHLFKLGLNANLDKNSINQIIKKTKNALGNWQKLAKKYMVSTSNIDLIGNYINK